VAPNDHRARERLFAATGVVGALWAVVYVWWRLTATRAGADPVLFWVLFAAEAYGILSFFVLVHTAWRVPPVQAPVAQRGYTVDVLVCTYNEPVEIVEATLAGCAAIRYPHTTYLCDDGRRPEMRDLAWRMGAVYVTRADNAHAKAGNINAALARTKGELLLVLDADHVPLPEVLDATVGYFDDPKVALVQTPHDFYNRDSVQHSDARRHEQSLFYEVIAPGKARHNGAYWCGSAAVIRRAALEDVGGVRYDTIAEDFHTTIAMHQRGWRTAYHAEILVQGLAPHDLDAFLLQRDRWARGNLWVFRTPQNPLTGRGLTLHQRLSYSGSLLSYGSGCYRFALLAVLTATLVLGRLPLASDPVPLLAIWMPWMLLTTLGSIAIGRGSLALSDTWRYGLLTMGIFTRAVLATVFGRRSGKFKVTPKGSQSTGSWRVVRSLALLSTMTTLLAAGVAVRLGALAGLVPVPRMPAWSEWLTVGLGAWTLLIIWSAVRPLVRRRQLRGSWRFPVTVSGTHDGEMVKVVDLSPEGAGVILAHPAEPGSRLDVHVRLPGPGAQERTVRLPLEVRSSRPAGDAYRAGGVFVDLAPRDRALLVHYCYVVALTGSVPSHRPAGKMAVEDRAVGEPHGDRIADSA